MRKVQFLREKVSSPFFINGALFFWVQQSNYHFCFEVCCIGTSGDLGLYLDFSLRHGMFFPFDQKNMLRGTKLVCLTLFQVLNKLLMEEILLTTWHLLGQWLNFKLFGITYLVEKNKVQTFFTRFHPWRSVRTCLSNQRQPNVGDVGIQKPSVYWRKNPSRMWNDLPHLARHIHAFRMIFWRILGPKKRFFQGFFVGDEILSSFFF